MSPQERLATPYLVPTPYLVLADDTEGASIELLPESENRFIVFGTTIEVEFIAATADRAQETRITGVGPKPIVSQKLDAFAPPKAELLALAGEYTSPELQVTYTISVRASALVIQMPGRPDVVLRPIYPDGFAGAVVSVVKFSRDVRGAVTGFTLHSSGVRGLRFDRLKP